MGHIVSFEHNNPDALGQQDVLPTISLGGLLDIIYVGTKDDWNRLIGVANTEPRSHFLAKHAKILQLRAHCILMWLNILHRVNPLYSSVQFHHTE